MRTHTHTTNTTRADPTHRPEQAYEASKRMLRMAHVSLRQHGMTRPLLLRIDVHR